MRCLASLVCFCSIASAGSCGGEEFAAKDGDASTSGSGGAATMGAGGSMTTGGGGAGASANCPSGSRCAPPVPDDWTGPAIVYIGADDPPNDCGAGWTDKLEGWSGSVTGSWFCSDCSCGAPTGSCEQPWLKIGLDCNDAATNVPQQGAPGCTTIQFGIWGAIEATGGDFTGSCTPAGGARTVDPPVWQQRALLCIGGEGRTACGEGTCVPAAVAPFEATACVYQPGDIASCPSGYPNRSTMFLGIDDTRDCAKCLCEEPVGVLCTTSVTKYTDLGCTGTATSLMSLGFCYSGNFASYKTTASMPVNGECAPIGGDKVGEVKATQPVTVCCTPP